MKLIYGVVAVYFIFIVIKYILLFDDVLILISKTNLVQIIPYLLLILGLGFLAFQNKAEGE